MRFSEFEISGNSKQETRSGKNRIKSFSCELPKTIVSPSSGFSQYRAYWDEKYESDLALNGFTIKFKVKNILDKAFTSVILGQANSGGDKWSYRVNFNNFSRREDKEFIIYEYYKEKIDFTITENSFVIIFEDINQRVGCDLYDFEVNLGNTVGQDFEKYGKTPSTDYPSKISSCGDNINIFNGELEAGNINSIDGSNETTTSQAMRSKNYIEVLANREYTLSNFSNDLNTSGNSRFIEYDKDKKFVKITWLAQTSSKWTVTTSTTTKYVRFTQIQNTRNLNSNIKLEEGSKATGYSRHGQGCINEVICNKNFCNGELVGGTFSNGVPTTGLSTTRIRNNEYIKVKNNTEYTISANYSGTLLVMIMLYDKYKNLITSSSYHNVWKNMSFLFETTEDTAYLMFVFKDSLEATINSSMITDVQLEEGTATDYVEHQSQTFSIPTQQPFRTCGDYADTFVKINNKWYERHYIQKLILKGTEKWTRGGFTFWMSVLSEAKQIIESYNALSSHFISARGTTWLSGDESYRGKFSINNETTKMKFMPTDRNIENVDFWKTWLAEQYNAGTPVYVDYVLATPIDIECTAEQTAILDEIDNTVKSYKDVTHIYSTDEISANVKVTYKKDIETINKKQDDRITALEELLSSTVTSAMLLDNMQNDLESEVI